MLVCKKRDGFNQGIATIFYMPSMFTLTHTHIYLHKHSHSHTLTYTYTNIHTHTHIYKHSHKHSHILTHTDTHILTNPFTHTHSTRLSLYSSHSTPQPLRLRLHYLKVPTMRAGVQPSLTYAAVCSLNAPIGSPARRGAPICQGDRGALHRTAPHRTADSQSVSQSVTEAVVTNRMHPGSTLRDYGIRGCCVCIVTSQHLDQTA